MKILLFGTGNYYQKYKAWFAQEDIIGLIDNDKSKQGTLVDGHKVYLPQTAVKQVFDCVVILSVHEAVMRRQLIELGVPDDRIYKFSELHKHPEIIMDEQQVYFWGDDKSFSRIISVDCPDIILLMSHNLDLNGASLALFYFAQILKNNGFAILFVSWADGELKKYLSKEGIPTVVDPNLQIKTQKEIMWLQGFHRIVCNTLNYYQFLSDRNLEDKIIWWVHDHFMFYEGLDQKLLKKIRSDNLTVCAVGEISENSFKKFLPDFVVKQLVYGIPDVCSSKVPHEKLEFIMIGNIQKYKGQDILINALKMLDRKVRAQIHVRIVGFHPSAYANDVKKMAEGLEDIVSFIPPADREGIYSLLDEADILVCPSRIDTMSIVTNEGMQRGIPCIVSDAAGVSAYITNGVDGIITKRGDAKMLAEKIIWCIEHRDQLERIGKAARHLYEKYFSMEVFEGHLLNIVHEALL